MLLLSHRLLLTVRAFMQCVCPSPYLLRGKEDQHLRFTLVDLRPSPMPDLNLHIKGRVSKYGGAKSQEGCLSLMVLFPLLPNNVRVESRWMK